MDEPVVDDRKAAIEAAFEVEEARTPEAGAPEPEAKAPEPEAAKPEPEAAKPEPEPEAEPKATDRAPQSWKPATRAQWDKLPPEVREEVARREQQTAKVLNDNATARQVANSFHQAVQPYQARLQSLGVDPIAAAQELFRADYLLTTAPKAQRAEFMAKLIKDYDIDIEALDGALAGRVTQAPGDQIQAQVQQLLQQQLAPYQQLLQREQQREQEESQGLYGTIQQMAANTEKYPYFSDVREEMADIIDLAAKRGRQMSLDEAYNRATLLDPEISKLTQASQAAQNAAKATAQAQRARQASVSVGGAPSGLLSGSPTGDRRAIIAAAFDSQAGR